MRTLVTTSRRSSSVTLAFFATVTLSVCIMGDPVSRDIGVTVDDRGRLLVVGTKCGFAGPVVVTVSNMPDASYWKDALIYWQVTAKEPPVPIEIFVGTTPRGFRETVPLKEPLSSTGKYYAQIDYPNGRASDVVDFQLSSLTAGQVETGDDRSEAIGSFVATRTEDWCG